MLAISFNTLFPIFFLVALGALSRQLKVTKAGQEKVFSTYVYYFALPALFFINMAEAGFGQSIISFVVAGIMPLFIAVLMFITAFLLFRFKKNSVYLLVFSTAFGSHAFFGIPFLMFVFPDKPGENLAVISAASIAIISVIVTILVLELYSIHRSSFKNTIIKVLKKFAVNPLIISVLTGIICGMSGFSLPLFLSSSLHLVGGTTAPVSLFMLGVFLYGRKYGNLLPAFGLSLLRMALLPAIAVLSVRYFGITGREAQAIILMNAMPVAVSMIVLSERYNFYKETVASLVLISSAASFISLPIWLWIAGIR